MPDTKRPEYIGWLDGHIYKKDNGGRPVRTWPDVEKEGWVLVSIDEAGECRFRADP
jgi:hypothetical protein